MTTPQPIEFQGNRYSWSLEVTLSGAQQVIELTNDNAKADALVTEIKNPPGAAGSNDLNVLFEKLKNSVVKVRAEGHDGSGFIVDPSGLVVTNNHGIGKSCVGKEGTRNLPSIHQRTGTVTAEGCLAARRMVRDIKPRLQNIASRHASALHGRVEDSLSGHTGP